MSKNNITKTKAYKDGMEAQNEVQRQLEELLPGKVSETRQLLAEMGAPENSLSFSEQTRGDLLLDLGADRPAVGIEVTSSSKYPRVSLNKTKLQNFKGDYHCFVTRASTVFIKREHVDQALEKLEFRASEGEKPALYKLIGADNLPLGQVIYGVENFIKHLGFVQQLVMQEASES